MPDGIPQDMSAASATSSPISRSTSTGPRQGCAGESGETGGESLGDAHCHLSVDITRASVQELVEVLNGYSLRDRFFSVMSTNHIDINYLDSIVDLLVRPLVLPYFGIHPWYSHLFTDMENTFDTDLEYKKAHYSAVLNPEPPSDLIHNLPVPIHIDHQLQKIENLCSKHGVFAIGELGLDKSFRVPTNGYYGNQDIPNDGETRLSSCRVSMQHQTMVFSRQLQLADSLRCNISVHCVNAHGILYNTIPKYKNIPKIILHSFSGSIDQAKLWVRQYAKSEQNLAFSFSNYINGEKLQQLEGILKSLQDDQVLVETDFSLDKHLKDDYFVHLEAISRTIQKIKGWSDNEVYSIVRNNLYS